MLKLSSTRIVHIHLPSSVILCDTALDQPLTSLWTTGSRTHSAISPEIWTNPEQCRYAKVLVTIFPASIGELSALRRGPLWLLQGAFHQLRFKFNRSIRVEEITHWCKQDFTQTRQTIWLLKRFVQHALICTHSEKSLGLEEKFPFFLDLSQDLLPWQGSSSSTHKTTPNTYANRIQLTT